MRDMILWGTLVALFFPQAVKGWAWLMLAWKRGGCSPASSEWPAPTSMDWREMPTRVVRRVA